jgi:hypothetical protein
VTAGPVVSLTRLRLRSARFLPSFALATSRSSRQARRAPGFLGGAVLADRRLTFWTLTAWASEEAMRAYLRGGAHGAVMPRLLHWCDEASVARWPGAALPAWPEAAERMRALGRPSRVRHPSPAHAALAFPDPRPTVAAPLHATRVAPTPG